ERAVRNGDIALDAAEPAPGEIVAGAPHRDGAVRTAAALLALTLSDHLDEERITARCTDARQLSGAIELGIAGFPSAGREGDQDAVFGFPADLRHRAGPGPGDRGRGGGPCRRRGRALFRSRR